MKIHTVRHPAEGTKLIAGGLRGRVKELGSYRVKELRS
jgi:hypothetical protein